MKRCRVFVSLTLLSLPSLSGGATYGEAYQPKDVAVVWAAPTCNLPARLWVYKVFPQSFSPAVISNLMAIGSFTSRNITKSPVESPDKHLIYFQIRKDNRTRYLSIAPTLGSIEYYDDSARADFGKEEAVPDESEAIRRARDLLFQTGLDRRVFDEKPTRMSTGRQGKVATSTSPGTEKVYSRGVVLTRLIDGVKSQAAGSLIIDFGNHGKIMDFNMVWLNLVPYQGCRVASRDEIIGWIKDGKATLPTQGENVTGARALTLRRITPYYQAREGTQPGDVVRPFAEIEVEADKGADKVTVCLYCPIVIEKTPN